VITVIIFANPSLNQGTGLGIRLSML